MKAAALLVGNGINDISIGIKWQELVDKLMVLCNCPKDIAKNKPFPLFYEEIFQIGLQNGVFSKETEVKQFISDEVSKIGGNFIQEAIRNLRFSHIMTTNYEFLLEGREFERNEGIIAETKFSIFRKYSIEDTTYWHLHGDCLHPDTINLGYEHYCGQLQQIRNYVTSTPRYKSKILTNSLISRIKRGNVDQVNSWIDLFFLRDIHIIGLTLDFVEIDLWWLLSFRARQKSYERRIPVDNSIYYYIPEEYAKDAKNKLEMLRALNVEIVKMPLTSYEGYYKKVLAKLKKLV